jgi:hypothetical protein
VEAAMVTISFASEISETFASIIRSGCVDNVPEGTDLMFIITIPVYKTAESSGGLEDRFRTRRRYLKTQGLTHPIEKSLIDVIRSITAPLFY